MTIEFSSADRERERVSENSGVMPKNHFFYRLTLALVDAGCTVLENLITVWNVKQAVGLHCI